MNHASTARATCDTTTRRRRLWKEDSISQSVLSPPTNPKDRIIDDASSKRVAVGLPVETYDSIVAQFSHTPTRRSFFRLCSNAVVVVQECAMTAFLLAKHRSLMAVPPPHVPRRHEGYQTASTVALYTALLLTIVYSAAAASAAPSTLPVQQSRGTKARQRTWDAALLAIVLRWSAALLQSLTASYSSDTVERLVWLGVFVHLLLCDYAYANGRPTVDVARSTPDPNATETPYNTMARPSFQGGTVSLTAVLFATTLLLSRLPRPTPSDPSVYSFVFFAMVLFALYPVTRHAISTQFPSSTSPAHWWITGCMCLATWCLLVSLDDTYAARAFLAIMVCLGVGLPAWKYWILQPYQRQIRGPWDIPTSASMQLDYTAYVGGSTIHDNLRAV